MPTRSSVAVFWNSCGTIRTQLCFSSATLCPIYRRCNKVEALFAAGKMEARCYTAKKFHAKAYLIDRPDIYPPEMGIIGSGNFTWTAAKHRTQCSIDSRADEPTECLV